MSIDRCPVCRGIIPGYGLDSEVCRCGSAWMSERERDHLVVQMLTPASRLVEGVHGRDKAVCHVVLSSLSVVELQALAVTLAQLVPVGDVAVETLASLYRAAS